ncbi:MAG: PhoH family protein, partial [Modestobacter sp.]|nr:PhoH family protein [Modestobacter sp.]
MVALLGSGDELLRMVESELTADVHVRGNEIAITGQPADNAFAVRVIDELIALLNTGQALRPDSVRRVVGMLRSGGSERPAEVLSLDILSRRGRTIRPKTLNQKRYVDAIDAHTVIFGIGPAGTGKTYLAIAKAVEELEAGNVGRIVLSRPAVEAGESLGFLPGEMEDKLAPYLRPLYDALSDRLSMKRVRVLMAEGLIEIAPIGFMRGRTLNNAFVVI